MGGDGQGSRGGINCKIGTDINTLLYIKLITNKGLLYSTGNSTLSSVMAYMGKESKKEYIYIQEIYFAIPLKLTWYYRPTIFQSKFFKKRTFSLLKGASDTWICGYHHYPLITCYLLSDTVEGYDSPPLEVSFGHLICFDHDMSLEVVCIVLSLKQLIVFA